MRAGAHDYNLSTGEGRKIRVQGPLGLNNEFSVSLDYKRHVSKKGNNNKSNNEGPHTPLFSA